MRAMVLKQFGGVENFIIEEIPTPEPNKNEVLIHIKAIGIDQIDIKTRKGEAMQDIMKKEEPKIIGWDVSGEIVKTGSHVSDFKVGDEVFGTINFPGPGSSYAEFAVAPADQLALKPGNISYVQAAAATQSPLTAWQALVDTGHINKGERVLIHGGAGGVGNYAIQIARNMGCYVITTAAQEDFDFVKGLGADQCIDYKKQHFDELLADHKVDFILDTIGGENFVRSLKVLKPEGRIVLLPSNKKDEADKVATEQQVKNYKHILMHSSGKDMQEISRMLADRRLIVSLEQTFPFEEIPEAHQLLESGKVRGKIAISVI